MPTGWQSVTTLPRVWLVSGLVVCALFAGGVSLFSGDSLHRLWGLSAACAYAVAALLILAWRSRAVTGIDIALGVLICGAILFPLLWMVLHESLAVTVAGVIVGLPLAIASVRVLRSTLFGLGPGDPASFVAALIGMACVSLVASLIPARRAASVDPMRALRTE